MVILIMKVTPCRVRLPDFDQAMGNRASFAIDYPPADNNAFPEGLMAVLPRKVTVGLCHLLVPKQRPCDFRQGVRQNDQGPGRSTTSRAQRMPGKETLAGCQAESVDKERLTMLGWPLAGSMKRTLCSPETSATLRARDLHERDLPL
jgi:hypothetical protein